MGRLGGFPVWQEEPYRGDLMFFGNLTLHLVHDEGGVWTGYLPECHMTSVLYVHVDDADQLAADKRAAGASVEGPRNEDYGKR